MQTRPAYEALVAHHRGLHRLEHLQALASWDRQTRMPPGGAAARAAAQAELAEVLQQRRGDPVLATRLAAAATEPLEPDERANLREMERQHRLAGAVPAALAVRLSERSSAAMTAWGPARQGNDWPAFATALGPLVEAVREQAARLGDAFGLAPYDALLERWDRGLRAARLDALLDDVGGWLPALVQAARARQDATPAPIEPAGPFDEAAQQRLCERVMRLLGFDFRGGRLDTSAHPFTVGVPEDVRLTTRFEPGRFLPALLGTMHETGHACYFQNGPQAWLDQPLAEPHSASLHEGQALCLQRHVAPHAGFAVALAPLVAEAFGEQPAFSPANLLRLMTRLGRTPLRTEADELASPAHVMVRVEIERALVDATLDVDDIPACWNQRMRDLLDIDLGGDVARGPLADPHWAGGMFGYYPSYLLGAMTAAQCFEAIEAAAPDLDRRLAAGDATPVAAWLREHVWRQGARFDADDILRRATGRPLDAGAFRRHLERRYGGGA